MTGNKLPQRKSKIGRKIALGVGILLLAMVTIFAIVKREMIWNLFHLNQIEMRSASEMRALVKEGDYTILIDTEDTLEYTASDGTMTVRVLTEGDEITRIDAGFNAYDFDVSNVSEAEKIARDLLSPYYTDPQIEAMALVIATDIAPSLNLTSINYTNEIGAYSVSAAAQMPDGNVEIKVIRSGADS